MSAIARATAPTTRPPQRDADAVPRRHLRLVPDLARAGRPAMRAVIGSLGVLGGVLLAQLLLSIVISQGAYEVQQLEQQQTAVGREASALGERVDQLSSAQNLAGQATGQGMVPGDGFVMLDTTTGQVTGGESATNPAITPGLVGNEALNPTAPNAANPNASPIPTAPGVAPGQSDAGAVPSATDLDSPTTR